MKIKFDLILNQMPQDRIMRKDRWDCIGARQLSPHKAFINPHKGILVIVIASEAKQSQRLPRSKRSRNDRNGGLCPQ